MSDQLEPCPWCGPSVNSLRLATGNVTAYNCTCCGCLGPWNELEDPVEAEQAAREGWNTRWDDAAMDEEPGGSGGEGV